MTWVDLALLTILLISVLVGIVRGLVFEVLSLLGWIAALLVAYWGAPQVADMLPLSGVTAGLKHGIAFGLLFLVSIIVWGLIARMLRTLIRSSPLSGIDRVLGAVFGAARGVLLLFVIVTLASLTPMRSSDAWRSSQGAAMLDTLLKDLKPALPPEVTRLLPA
jgi:membrane protein required for colicin V production